MKHLIFLIALISAGQESSCAPEPIAQNAQSFDIATIRVYSPDGDISNYLNVYNEWLASERIQFVLVNEQGADVTVRFGLNIKDANAVAYPLKGEARFKPNSLNAQTELLHEILHCAGVPHDPDDPTSIMYTYSGTKMNELRYIKRHHIEALRHLAGITPLGRIGAQIGVMR